MHDTEAPTTQAERDAAQWRETAGRYLSALVAAERQRDEVGIQLVAAQAEIVRMRRVVEIARARILRRRRAPRARGVSQDHGGDGMNYVVEVRPKNKTRALAVNDQQVLRVILKAENRDVAKQRAEGCWVKTCHRWRRALSLTSVVIGEGTAGDYMDTAIILDPADHSIPHVIMDCLVVRP